MTPAAVIEISDLSKAYGALRPLRVAQLAVAAGESVAIVGLDQPAAEIFLNLLTGATLPDRGTVRVFERATSDLVDANEWLALVDRFGIVSERAVLLEGLTVAQNLAVPFTLDIEPLAGDVRGTVETLAAEVGIDAATLARPAGDVGPTLRARVRLARALALDPAVLLLEHLSAGVPRGDVAALAASIRQVAERRGSAVIAATADLEFARAVAKRVLTLEPATGKLSARRGWFR